MEGLCGETLPMSFSVFAARFCNVLCCVVKLMKMFSYFACVLSTCTTYLTSFVSFQSEQSCKS